MHHHLLNGTIDDPFDTARALIEQDIQKEAKACSIFQTWPIAKWPEETKKALYRAEQFKAFKENLGRLQGSNGQDACRTKAERLPVTDEEAWNLARGSGGTRYNLGGCGQGPKDGQAGYLRSRSQDRRTLVHPPARTPYAGGSPAVECHGGRAPSGRSPQSSSTSSAHGSGAGPHGANTAPSGNAARRTRYDAAVLACEMARLDYQGHLAILKGGGHSTFAGEAAYEAWQHAYEEMNAAKEELSKVDAMS